MVEQDTFDLKEFIKLKDAAQKKRRDLDRAQGEFDSLTLQLSRSHGCTTVEIALHEKKRLQQELDELAVIYNKKLAEFEEEFGKKL